MNQETLHFICQDRIIESEKISDLQRHDKTWPSKDTIWKENCPGIVWKTMIWIKHAWTRSCKMMWSTAKEKLNATHYGSWIIFIYFCSSWIKCTYPALSAPLARSLAHCRARAPLPVQYIAKSSKRKVYAFLEPTAYINMALTIGMFANYMTLITDMWKCAVTC
jgi:hypothetical protein